MKKTIVKIIIATLFILTLLFAEYRFIIHNIKPYYIEGCTVYLDIFGNIESYYSEDIINWK